MRHLSIVIIVFNKQRRGFYTLLFLFLLKWTLSISFWNHYL